VTDADLIERIATAVAARVKVPLGVQLWSSDEIAAYLCVSKRQAAEKIVMLPGFPQPIRLPVLKGGRGHPRWKAAEVIEWVDRFQEKRAA
jgi:predicted DNA-binding transcriptional regulator AlpA